MKGGETMKKVVEEIVISSARSIGWEDVKKAVKNSLIFAAPALIVLAASFKDLIPEGAEWGVLALYVLNLVTDLFKKWVSENKYIKKVG